MRRHIGQRVDDAGGVGAPKIRVSPGANAFFAHFVAAQRRADNSGGSLADIAHLVPRQTGVFDSLVRGHQCKLRGSAHAPRFFGADNSRRIEVFYLAAYAYIQVLAFDILQLADAAFAAL